jgi:AcrR family transcriptional regulator
VPKISAPTVAEHRAQRLRALLSAARDVVAEEGPDALTLGTLAQRVGLSRPSVYEYFRSRDDLVAAIVEDEMPRWEAELTASVDRESSPVGRIAAYVRTQLGMLRDGQHAAAVALSAHTLGDDYRDRIRAEHERLTLPLVAALRDAGVPDPRLRAQLIQGVINAAAPLVAGGGQAVIEGAVAQVLHGVAAAQPVTRVPFA